MPGCSLKVWAAFISTDRQTDGIDEDCHREWAGGTPWFNPQVRLSWCVGSHVRAIFPINSPKADGLNNMKCVRVCVSDDGEGAAWLYGYEKMFVIEHCIFVSKFPIDFIAV